VRHINGTAHSSDARDGRAGQPELAHVGAAAQSMRHGCRPGEISEPMQEAERALAQPMAQQGRHDQGKDEVDV
jgi:hypothetical protein